MHGNASEWTIDYYGCILEAMTTVDPNCGYQVHSGGLIKYVTKGGNFHSSLQQQRSAARYSFTDTMDSPREIGFRLIRTRN